MDGYTMEVFATMRQREALDEAATRRLLRAARPATDDPRPGWRARLHLGVVRRFVRLAGVS
jgi:hypothetical protein